MKKARKAIAINLFSLFVCISLLIGTTLAWFTDQATSGVNKIIAGNLDVDLVMWNGDEYVSISGEDSAIFGDENSLVAQNDSADTLWEPGKTQIVYLGVRNNGNLALKYNIVLNIIDGGLIGALEYAILDGVDASAPGFVPPASWDEIKAISGVQTGDVVAGTIVAAQNGVLDGIAQNPPIQNETDYFALAVHMKEDAGNEYMGKDITIDVTVVAGQMTAESDSFDNQYDKDAKLGVITVTPSDINEKLMNLENNTELVLQPAYDENGNPVSYGVIDLTQGLESGDTLENIVISGSAGAVVERILISGSNDSKGVTIDNLTIRNLVIYNSTSANDLIRFSKQGTNTLKRLVIENCTIIADDSDNSFGFGLALRGDTAGLDDTVNTADIVIRNCRFVGIARPIYATNACWNSLTVENCVFENIKETVIYCQGGNTIKSISVIGNTFKDCKNRILRPNNGGLLPYLTKLHFKDNTFINCVSTEGGIYFHVTIPSSAETDFTGNIKDGLAWDITQLITISSLP